MDFYSNLIKLKMRNIELISKAPALINILLIFHFLYLYSSLYLYGKGADEYWWINIVSVFFKFIGDASFIGLNVCLDKYAFEFYRNVAGESFFLANLMGLILCLSILNAPQKSVKISFLKVTLSLLIAISFLMSSLFLVMIIFFFGEYQEIIFEFLKFPDAVFCQDLSASKFVFRFGVLGWAGLVSSYSVSSFVYLILKKTFDSIARVRNGQ